MKTFLVASERQTSKQLFWGSRILLILLCFSLGGCAHPRKGNLNEQTGRDGSPTASLVDLAEQWRSGKISSTAILHAQTDVHYVLEFTPDRLDADAPFKLIVTGPNERQVTKELMRQIKGLSVQAATQESYPRWGFIFFSPDGARVHSIYIDGTGTKGVIDNQNVIFGSDALFRWAETNFQSAFKF